MPTYLGVPLGVTSPGADGHAALHATTARVGTATISSWLNHGLLDSEPEVSASDRLLVELEAVTAEVVGSRLDSTDGTSKCE